MNQAGTENMKRWLSFLNDSGEEIPPYAVMMLESDTEDDPTTVNFKKRLRFIKPDSRVSQNNMTYALNSAQAVAIGEYGKCHFANDAAGWGRIESNSGSATWDLTDPTLEWVGEEWGPTDGRWDINIDGRGFLIQSAPDLDRNRVLVRQVDIAALRPVPDGECYCCPGVACWPNPEITACAAIPCLYDAYVISGNFPWAGGEFTLQHDTLCDYVSDSFSVTICGRDFGTHHWEMTVGTDPWTTILTLVRTSTYGQDIPLEYRSEWYWNAIASNPMGWVFTCDFNANDDLKVIAPRFQRRICVKPDADDCAVCAEDLPDVDVPCCSEGITRGLRATIVNEADCAGMDGDYIDIDYTGATGGGLGWPHWFGSGLICGESIDFHLWCISNVFYYATTGNSCITDGYSVSAVAPLTGSCKCLNCTVPVLILELLSGTLTSKVGCGCCTPPNNQFHWRVTER